MSTQRSLFDQIERLHNRASDTAFVWFPFNRLRPASHQPITFARRVAMTICFGIYFGVMLSLRQSLFADEPFFGVVFKNVGVTSLFFFFWFNTVTATFWNRRARRSIQEGKNEGEHR